MTGSIVKRSRTAWSLVVDQGRDANGRRRQRWHTFKVPTDKTEKQADKLAQAALRKLLHQLDTNTYVDASKMTLAGYLKQWHTKITPLRDPETARVYGAMLKHVAAAPVGGMLLQKVTASDLEHFYATAKPRKGKRPTLAAGTIQLLHAVINEALGTAARDRLIVFNPAKNAKERPKRTKIDAQQMARKKSWSAEEARQVIAAAKEAGAQVEAFIRLALNTGARKSELLGLTWANVDLDKAEITIAQQLAPRAATLAEFKPTKTRKIRVVPIGAETAAVLRAHRKQQRELMMANRKVYLDADLVFAKRPEDQQTPKTKLGEPCYALADSHFRRVIKAAGVKPIGVHGMRHSCATLLLAAGEPVKDVADRLGHEKPSMTLDVYTHATAGAQRDAAGRLDAALSGR
jgi:integrase